MLNDLTNLDDFESFSSTYQDVFIEHPLSVYLQSLLQQQNLSKAEVIKKSNLDRVYGYQIFNGTRMPTREKLLQVAFGLALDVDATQDLLKISGMAPLYTKKKRDAAILFCLSKRFDFDHAQDFLYQLNLKLIGE